MLQLMENMNKSLYASPAPLLEGDLGDKFTPRSIQEVEVNPNVSKMFGHDETFNVGYVLNNYPISPKAAGEMLRTAQRHYMPAGYIPTNYHGMHPKITGWRTWNKAHEQDMTFLIGDLTKGNILYSDAPFGAKQPFIESGTRTETFNDLKNTNRNKASEVGDPDC